jgi:hypothetical protein
MSTTTNKLERLPYWITGDSFDTLQGYDSNSRKKIHQLGWFVLIPTMLWFLTGYLAQTELLGGSPIIGLVTASICASFIFIIERSLVIARRAHWFLVIVRITLGLVVAGLGSFIVDLVIFKSDINVYAIQKYKEKAFLERKKIHTLELAWTDSLNREMKGSGGSRQRGYGVISQEMKKQLSDIRAQGSAMDSIQRLEEEYFSDEGNQHHKAMIEKIGLNTIIHRSSMLHKLIAEDAITRIVWLSLLMLGLLIEVMPVISKLATKKSAYELDLEAQELILANRRQIAIRKSNFYMNQSYGEQKLYETLKKDRRFPYKKV